MEGKFNTLIEISVSKNKYTYFFLVLSFLLWFSNNMLNTGIILLTRTSKVKFFFFYIYVSIIQYFSYILFLFIL